MQSASGGKAEFQGQGTGTSGDLRDWLVQDLRSTSSAAGGSSIGAGGSGRQTFRTAAGQSQQEQQGMFQDFERGLDLSDARRTQMDFKPSDGLGQSTANLGQAWNEATQQERWQATGLDPTTAHPVRSYTDLDEPMHASVRANSFQTPFAAQNRTYAPPAAAPLAQTDDVFALLDSEHHSDPSPAIASTSQTTIPKTDSDLPEKILSQFDPLYRPPSPTHSSFSREQATLHLQLAESQASQQGKAELAVPRPDNPALQEGVYAPTAEQALQSIFEGRIESSDTREEEGGDRGEEIVRKITKWFGASSYLDDVYGESPVLRETIEVVRKEKEGDKEKRERAIRRLESLWGHLSNTPPQQRDEKRGADWVDGWLLKNT